MLSYGSPHISLHSSSPFTYNSIVKLLFQQNLFGYRTLILDEHPLGSMTIYFQDIIQLPRNPLQQENKPITKLLSRSADTKDLASTIAAHSLSKLQLLTLDAASYV